VLSERGREVLRDEELLRRLRQGQALTPGDWGGTVREVLRRQGQPQMTRLLILSNVLVFVWGVWLASPNAVGPFLGATFGADARVLRILQQTGAATAPALMRGEWWRLLTCCWVHIGLMHLLFNMYALNGLGRSVEQLYGRWRYLVLYVLAGFCGSCLGMMQASLLAGASGAVCGVFGAEGVWMLLNGRYLPRSLNRRARATLLINFLLLTFISLFPGISGLGHLGGAVAGASAGVLLNWQRFGRSPLRWLALPALAVLPWAGLYLLNHARATSPEWQKLERQEQKRERSEFESKHLQGIIATLQAASRICEDNELAATLRHDPADREQPALARFQEQLAQQQGKLAELEVTLQQLGPYHNETVEEARVTARSYAAALRGWVEAIQRVLAAGDKVTPEEKEQLKEKSKEADRLKAAWEKLLE
jgi:rhomboid protease GluP